MRYELVTADVPNRNGRIYPAEIVEQMYNTIQNRITYAQLDAPRDPLKISFERIIGKVVNPVLSDGVLTIELEVYENSCSGKIYNELVKAKVDLYAASIGIGHIGEDKVVTDLDLTSVAICSEKKP